MTDIVVREATHEDIPDISYVATSSFIDAFAQHTDPEELAHDLEENRSEKYFNKVFDDDTILVADNNGTVVAYIQFGDVTHTHIEHTTDDCELRRLYVLTSHHRRGIGVQLMDAMLSHSRVQNKKRMLLNVWDINTSAIALYERYGFVNTGKHYPYFFEGKEVGHDDIYQKVLS